MLALPAHYDHVGSFLRPAYLLQARQQFAAGTLTTARAGDHHSAGRYTGTGAASDAGCRQGVPHQRHSTGRF